MSERISTPNLPRKLLRDHATEASVDRVWQRVEASLAEAEPARSERRFWPAVGLAVAASFAVGLFVGMEWTESLGQGARAEGESVPVAELVEPAEGPRSAGAIQEEAGAPSGAKKVLVGSSARHPRRPKAAQAPAIPSAEPRLVSPAQPDPAPTPSWYLLADQGDFEGARGEVEALGGFDKLIKSASVDELMSLADIARATGSRRHLLTAWREVGLRFPESDHAAVAALSLGNVLLEAGDHSGAAEAFERVRRLNPKGQHVEDALAGEFDVAVEQQNVEQAQKLAEDYARQFPDGPRLGEMQRQLEKLLGEVQGPGARGTVGTADTKSSDVGSR